MENREYVHKYGRQLKLPVDSKTAEQNQFWVELQDDWLRSTPEDRVELINGLFNMDEVKQHAAARTASMGRYSNKEKIEEINKSAINTWYTTVEVTSGFDNVDAAVDTMRIMGALVSPSLGQAVELVVVEGE